LFTRKPHSRRTLIDYAEAWKIWVGSAQARGLKGRLKFAWIGYLIRPH
jgi:hypothetical protein